MFIFATKDETPYVLNSMNKQDSEMIHKDGFFAKIFPVKDECFEKKEPKSFAIPRDLVDISDDFSMGYFNAGIMRGDVVYTEQVLPLQKTCKI